MVKCCECGKFCRPVEWMTVYLGSPPEPYDQIYGLRKIVWMRGEIALGCQRPEFVDDAQISPNSSIATRRAMSTP
jgi:hypothetical protein